MKIFLKKIILFSILVTGSIFILIYVCSYIVNNRNFKNYETESNLLVMKSNETYDILFMGISHARNFSRHKNHLRVESILEKKIFNLGQGSGKCGINEQLYYLDFLYRKNNKVKTLIYIISPSLFYSETLPIASNTFDKEPFDINFAINYLNFESENKYERLFQYLKSKLSREWLNLKPYSKKSHNKKLDNLNTNAIKAGQKMFYDNRKSLHRLNKSKTQIRETINLAIKQKSKVILIIPPALFGKWKGHFEIKEFGEKMKKIKGVDFYDFSESVLKPELYYDSHHLNTNGVNYFTEKYLRPILN